jgi:hypothetical protein
VSVIVGSLPFAGEAERLAWVAAAQHIDRLDGRPVDGGHVAEVRRVGPPPLKHRRRVTVDLGLPPERHPGPLEAEVESADTGEQRADPHLKPNRREQAGHAPHPWRARRRRPISIWTAADAWCG